MIDEPATTNTESTVADTPAKPATRRKSVPRSSAKKAPGRSKPTARNAGKPSQGVVAKYSLKKSGRTVLASVSLVRGKLRASADRVQEMLKTVVYVQLGVYGKVYDGFSSGLDASRQRVPKQWDALIKRGERMQKGLEKSGEELKARVKKIRIGKSDGKGETLVSKAA